MSNSSKFKLNVTYLEDNINAFCKELWNMGELFAYVTEVETMHKSHEEHAPDKISVYPLNNGLLNSQNLLKKIYGNFYVDGQTLASTKITKKFPGVIVLPYKAKQHIYMKIMQINKIKQECAESFRKLANNHEDRFKIAHEIFPMLISFQVFRELQCIEQNDEINRIKFYWRETMVTKKFNRQQLLEYLYNKKTFIADKNKLFNKNLAVWCEVDSFIEAVSQLPKESQFRIKRHSTIPTPAANISMQCNDKSIILNKRSSIPIIVFSHPQKIVLLNDYRLDLNRTANRCNKSKYTDFIPSINLELAIND